MKNRVILISVVLALAGIPLAIGSFMNKESDVYKVIMIDQPYFQVISDITNNFEALTWRTNLDTLYQGPIIDGYETWIEKYPNGDSILVKILKITEFTLATALIDAKGNERMRNIMVQDVNGKTAVKMIEEINIPNPYMRFVTLFYDPYSGPVKEYLHLLKEKYKNAPPQPM